MSFVILLSNRCLYKEAIKRVFPFNYVRVHQLLHRNKCFRRQLNSVGVHCPSEQCAHRLSLKLIIPQQTVRTLVQSQY